MECIAHQTLNLFLGLSIHDSVVIAIPPFPAKLPHITFGVLCGPYIGALPTDRGHYAGFDERDDKGDVLGTGGIPFVGRTNDAGLIVPHVSIPINNALLPLTIAFGSSNSIFGSSSVKVPTYNWIFGYEEGDLACTWFPFPVSPNIACQDWIPAPFDLVVAWGNVKVGVTWADLVAAFCDYAKEFAFAGIGRKLGGSPDKGITDTQKAARKSFKAQKKGMKWHKKFRLKNFDTDAITKKAFDVDKLPPLQKASAQRNLTDAVPKPPLQKASAQRNLTDAVPKPPLQKASAQRNLTDAAPKPPLQKADAQRNLDEYEKFKRTQKRTFRELFDGDEGVEGIRDELKRSILKNNVQKIVLWGLRGLGVPSGPAASTVGHPQPTFESGSHVASTGQGNRWTTDRSPFPMKVTWDKDVKDFRVEDIETDGTGIVSQFQGGPTEWNFSVTPTKAQVKLEIPARAGEEQQDYRGKVEDFFWRSGPPGRLVHHEHQGLRYPNKGTGTHYVEFTGTRPSVWLGATSPTRETPIVVTAEFDRKVDLDRIETTGPGSLGLDVAKAPASNFRRRSDTCFQFELEPQVDPADIEVLVKENRFTAPDGQRNTQSAPLVIAYSTQPVKVIVTPAPDPVPVEPSTPAPAAPTSPDPAPTTPAPTTPEPTPATPAPTTPEPTPTPTEPGSDPDSGPQRGRGPDRTHEPGSSRRPDVSGKQRARGKQSPVPFEARFSEPVEGFGPEAVQVVQGGRLDPESIVQESPTLARFSVVPTVAPGDVVVEVPSGGVRAASGNTNVETATGIYSFTPEPDDLLDDGEGGYLTSNVPGYSEEECDTMACGIAMMNR